MSEESAEPATEELHQKAIRALLIRIEGAAGGDGSAQNVKLLAESYAALAATPPKQKSGGSPRVHVM